ncbi:MAG: YlxR family protein [Candidatus Rokuibacteriota bacterium]
MTVRVGAPQRTCLGCRQSRPQAALLRLVRTAEGSVEPDPGRRLGGRGAYLCPNESCLSEALRRARWAHAFRAPATLSPEAVAKLRLSIGAAPPLPTGGGCRPRVSAARRPGIHVEGGW